MLKIVKLQKTFGGLMALASVSFNVKEGTVTSVIGPNGAGKTTLINVISGIYLPDSGSIFFEGNDITGMYPYKMPCLGITRTFQNLQGFENMTALENVMVGYHTRTSSGFLACLARTVKVRREDREALENAREMLAFVNLTGREDHPASSLSYGDQKRLELARALVSRPKMILLDEPVAGLNAAETEETARLILMLKDSGITIVLVEHDMNLVMEVSDKIIVLNYGEKIAQGSPVEIQNDDKVISAYLGMEVNY